MTPEFRRLVPLADLDRGPVDGEIAADEEECRALARRFDLVALGRLDARYRLVREGDDVLLSGDFSADLTQNCVRTLADIPVHISESFAIRFRPAAALAGDEVEIDPESGEDIEVLESHGIDVGEAVAQSLSLALDPFPRLAENGAASDAGEETGTVHPAFAILRKLRDNA